MPEAQIVRATERSALVTKLAAGARARCDDKELFRLTIVIAKYLMHPEILAAPNKAAGFNSEETDEKINTEFLVNILPPIRNESRDPAEVPMLLILASEKIWHYACAKFTAALHRREADNPELILRAESAQTLVPLTFANIQKG